MATANNRYGETSAPARYGRLSGLGKLQPNVDPVRIYEARIVTRLAGGSAIFCESQRILYFHDSSQKQIDDAISHVMRGLGRTILSQPVRIDDVGYFRVARKVPLSEEDYPAVVSALRLLGVDIRRIRTGIPLRALDRCQAKPVTP